MFQVGGPEFLVIVIVALIAVGPDQLPSVVRKLGRWASQARTMTSGLRNEFMAGIDEIEASIQEPLNEVKATFAEPAAELKRAIEDPTGTGEDSAGGGEDSAGGGEDPAGGGEDPAGGGENIVDASTATSAPLGLAEPAGSDADDAEAELEDGPLDDAESGDDPA